MDVLWGLVGLWDFCFGKSVFTGHTGECHSGTQKLCPSATGPLGACDMETNCLAIQITLRDLARCVADQYLY